MLSALLLSLVLIEPPMPRIEEEPPVVAQPLPQAPVVPAVNGYWLRTRFGMQWVTLPPGVVPPPVVDYGYGYATPYYGGYGVGFYGYRYGYGFRGGRFGRRR